MKTIRVKKENFDIDGICNKITEAISSGSLGCEGTVHPAIIDCIDNKSLYSTSMYDDMDYETVKDIFYKGEVGLALAFATMGSEDGYIGCANKKEYKLKTEEDYYVCDEFTESNEIPDEESEIERLEVGVLTADYESVNVLYLDCYGDYIYISTAYYGGACCMRPASIVIESNWGELDKIVLEFIKPFINEGEYEIKQLVDFDSIDFYKHDMYVFDNNKLILTDPKIGKFTEHERGFNIDEVISYFKESDREFIPKDTSKLGRELSSLEMFILRNCDEKIYSIIEKLEEEPSTVKQYIAKVMMKKTKEPRGDLLKELKKRHNPLKDYLDKGYIKKSIKEINQELNIL